jgi:hypothetical protein
MREEPIRGNESDTIDFGTIEDHDEVSGFEQVISSADKGMMRGCGTVGISQVRISKAGIPQV